MTNVSGALRRPPTSLSRRSLLIGGLAAGGVALAGCGSSSSSSTSANGGTKPLPVQLVWLKNVQFAGSWIAQQRGYYRRFGVTPDLLAGGPTTTVEPLVVQGKALVGISNPGSVATAVMAVRLSGKSLNLTLEQQTLEAKAQNELVQPAGYSPADVLLMKPAGVEANVKTLGLIPDVKVTADLFDSSRTDDLSAA